MQAKRQPGSSFKPFVYLAALDSGMSPSTLVLDAPFVADQGPGLPKWKPTNYNTTKFDGPTTIRVGIEKSKNMMTARVGGKRLTPTLIDRVQDRNGTTIFRADNRPCEGCEAPEWSGQAPPILPDTREQVLDPATAYQMVSILQGVVERGTGSVIAAVGKPLAGKTGTTNDYQDNWFVGFSPDLAVGTYIGFDQPKTLGNLESGGRNAAPIFRDFMKEALAEKPGTAFRIPAGVRLVRVNPETGRPARGGDRKVIWEAFKPGTEPGAADGLVVSGIGVADDEAHPAAMVPGGSPLGGVTLAPSIPAPPPASGTGGLY
jgi:penicillin-binding protein 1A